MRVRAGRFFTGICMEQHLKVNKGVHEQVNEVFINRKSGGLHEGGP
jgi:hypothetical protein